MKGTATVLVLFSLLVSCTGNPSGLPEPQGYEGLLAQGWNSFKEAEFPQALDFFQAMEVDVQRPEAFLGRGYHFHTPQRLPRGRSRLSAGGCPAGSGAFSCVYQRRSDGIAGHHVDLRSVHRRGPAPDSLEKWLSFTADSGLVWVGNSIRGYLTDNGLSTDLSFRLQPEAVQLAACVELYNMQNGALYSADSISRLRAFHRSRYHDIPGPGNFYYQW